jgi:hypothetical protein
VRRSASVLLLAALVSAILGPIAWIGRDSAEHAGCSCPKRACFCAHRSPRLAGEKSCSRALTLRATGCGTRPTAAPILGPVLPDGEVAAGFVWHRATFEGTRFESANRRLLDVRRAIDPPPPKA